MVQPAGKEDVVYVVDDSHTIRELVMATLTHLGCRAVGMDNAKSCLEAIQKERPGLILLDYEMSPTRGDECCKIIKETPELSA